MSDDGSEDDPVAIQDRLWAGLERDAAAFLVDHAKAAGGSGSDRVLAAVSQRNVVELSAALALSAPDGTTNSPLMIGFDGMIRGCM